MTSTLQTGVLRISGVADPRSGTLPILSGIPPRTTDDDSLTDAEMRRNLGYGRPHTLLPYTKQDEYDRSRTDREVPSIVLENDVLTATFLPGYGGRLWSLIHRPSERELLHRNEILQPGNLALRDAWVAGGVEWNFGATGHWPLTCSPLHAVRLTAADGTPVLRMFEFERMRRVVVQIDAWLPAGSPVLYVHVSLHNPSESETPAYWWSNIAVPENDRVRVVGPAEHAYHFDYRADLKRVPFPDFEGLDRSYPGTLPQAADYFLDLPDDARPWIAALDENGSGLVQTSTGLLRGRKLFHWGTSVGGKRWQEWLSGPDSDYLEIQAGVARTQLEHVPLPGGTTWSWVEAYGRLDADAEAVHGTWGEARAAASYALAKLVPPSAVDAALESVGEFGRPEEVLFHGSGWGALEIAADGAPAGRPLGDAHTAHSERTERTERQQWIELRESGRLPFGDPQAEQEPWIELLVAGRLPVTDPPAPPVLGARWRALLEASASDWHAYYHLGLMRLADADDAGAHDAFKRSVDDHPTPWALRALAFLAPSAAEAADLMSDAHRLRPDLRELTLEVLKALLSADRAAEALGLIETLPESDRVHGRVRLAEANAALATGDLDRVRALLDEGISIDNLCEGEDSLDALWFAVYPDEPIPARYDFRMSGA